MVAPAQLTPDTGARSPRTGASTDGKTPSRSFPLAVMAAKHNKRRHMKKKCKAPAPKPKAKPQSKAQRNAELRRLIIEKAGVSKEWAKDHLVVI